MADRPIIFSAPMIAALLAGRKTQTRRILKPQPFNVDGVWWTSWRREAMRLDDLVNDRSGSMPYRVGDRLWVRENHQFRGASYNDGTEGDPNWSEYEWFRVWGCGGPGNSWDPEFPHIWSPSVHMGAHELSGPEHDEGPDVRGFATKVLPSIHMPRWASRLTLLVTDVRVERLNDISHKDAAAEGLIVERTEASGILRRGDSDTHIPLTCTQWRGAPDLPLRGMERAAFRDLWEHINGPESWDANPWVVAVSFTVHASNIDQLAIPPAATRPAVEVRHG